MRFIHTSDWHIGRQLHGQSLLGEQTEVLAQLIGYLDSEQADALVVAGDIYDRAVPPAAAVALLDQTLHRICDELKIPVLLIPGNHDSAERLAFGARQLRQAGVHILADLSRVAEPVTIAGVQFFGIPYNDPEQVRDCYGCGVKTHNEALHFLLEQIETAQPGGGTPRVLISHCFMDGSEDSESERPLAIGGADRVDWQCARGFDYVALGHLHGPQYRGEEHIRYSGSLLKYSFSEQYHNKGCVLVEIGEQEVTHRHLPLKPRRDLRVIEGLLDELLAGAAEDPGGEDYLLVRLLDQRAILDPMGKLRRGYPNVLHLEKPLLDAAREVRMQPDQLKRDELSLFRDFYQQMEDLPLSSAQEQALQRVIGAVQRAEADG